MYSPVENGPTSSTICPMLEEKTILIIIQHHSTECSNGFFKQCWMMLEEKRRSNATSFDIMHLSVRIDLTSFFQQCWTKLEKGIFNQPKPIQ